MPILDIGMDNTKQFLRMHEWFPEMDELVKQVIGQANTRKLNSTLPIIDSHMPSGPWSNMSIDFYGPFLNNLYLLVLVDD